ncbi:Uncharacterised protein [Mycobacteroides abscessus subsp. abscessus]|nr:Uncharacterised protein [Mycobacteroides abscessus subsp. abscessus]
MAENQLNQFVIVIVDRIKAAFSMALVVDGFNMLISQVNNSMVCSFKNFSCQIF